MPKKNWDKSWTKSTSQTVLTYVVVVTFLFIIKNPNPFIVAVIPSGVFISAIRIYFLLKKRWIEKYN